MRVAFTKMHGLGNDFIICDAPGEGFVPSAELWRRLAARRTGIGFDQALLLEKPRHPGTAAYYRRTDYPYFVYGSSPGRR